MENMRSHLDAMNSIVEHVYAEPSIPPVIAITEVGDIKSSKFLNCGIVIDKTSRPVLKIFDQSGSTVEEEDPSRKDIAKKYLILRNKKTNKVSIYGTNVTYFKKPDYLKMKTFEENTLNDKNQELNLAFGNKKGLRSARSKTKNDSNVSTDVFDNISHSSIMKQPTYSQRSKFLVYLPSGCNRFSDKLELVYPLPTLLNEYEIDLMTDYAKEIISMSPISGDNKDLSTFFITNLNRLPHKTIQNICLLTLADGLITLLKIKKADFNSRHFELYKNSEVINNKVLDYFLEYNVTGRYLTPMMKDKMECHLIIIMLSINMNELQLSWLSPFLSPTSQQRLKMLMKVVGASISIDDPTKYTLKMPLAPLPKVKNPTKIRQK